MESYEDRRARLQRGYALPILSGILAVLAFPPFNLWGLGFIAFAPFAIFLLQDQSNRRAFTGGALFGLIFSSYLAAVVLSDFAWLPHTQLFSGAIHALPIPLMMGVAAWAGGFALLFRALKRRTRSPLARALLLAVLLTINEWLIGQLFLGFDFNSLAYVGVHLPFFRGLAALGGMPLISFAIFFANIAGAEAVLPVLRRERYALPAVVPLIAWVTFLVALAGARQLLVSGKAKPAHALTIATIQTAEPINRHPFGSVGSNGAFHFVFLAQKLKEAEQARPNVIVYPYSPTLDVIGFGTTTSATAQQVMPAATFGAWLKNAVSPQTVFVTWMTALRGGKYVDEIEFWRDGKLLGSYQKRHLFAFLDYTPQWAERLGFYSTRIDLSAGTSTSPTRFDGVAAGALVCSEVTIPGVARQNAKRAGLLFAVGSEGIFSGNLVEAFNLMNTQLRAAETGVPVVRANDLGPSAFVDGTGRILSELPYDADGILVQRLRIPGA